VSSIYFYVPNLIGYARIIFAVMSFYYVYTSFELFFWYYSLSAALDMADGYAARALGQTTKFGAVLDMVTDRASTTCLIVVLAQFYPKYIYWFLFLVALDIVSHFAHIVSSLSSGHMSHKEMDINVNWLLKIYYTNRYVLAFLCFGNEGFFIFLHLLHFYDGPYISLGPLTPIGELIFGEVEMSLVKVTLFFFFFPIMFIKQTLNVIQLQHAASTLVQMDIAASRTRTSVLKRNE